MKYVLRDLGESAEINRGGRGPPLWRETGTLLGAAAGLALALYFTIGWIVEFALPLISTEREHAWFSGFELPSAYTPDADTQKRLDLADAILRKLATAPGVPAIPYRLSLLDETQPNAFALPGGTVAITRGLLDLLGDDEIALAFVLAHELGHFAQRDQLRGIGRQFGRTLVWALIFGGNGGDVLTGHTGALLELGHSRKQEAGADRFAMGVILATYGRAASADRLFRWLDEKSLHLTGLDLLATHPAPADRVEALRRYAQEFEVLP